MDVDLGQDQVLSARFAKQHECVMQALQNREDVSQMICAPSNKELLGIKLLSDLKDALVSPDALCLREIPMRKLAATWGLNNLADWGFTFRHMVICGLNRTDLPCFNYNLCCKLNINLFDLLELRPRPCDIAAMRFSVEHMRALGCTSDWMCTVGYNYNSMLELHPAFSLSDWCNALESDPKWSKLGFINFDQCVQAGWSPEELYNNIFKSKQQTKNVPTLTRSNEKFAKLNLCLNEIA